MPVAATAPNISQQAVGRLPQTTQGTPGGGPFVRYAQDATAQGYIQAGVALGGLVTLPVPPQAGFLRGFVIKVAATGGTGAAVVTAAADAPWNVISQLTVQDSQGTTVYPAIDGYSLFLINAYSGMAGSQGRQLPSNLPSYSAIQTTSGSGAGNFTFRIWVPFELNSSGYGSLPVDNSAETPKLRIQTNASASVYTTAPSTLPTLTFTVEEDYWGVPGNLADLAPFDAGASGQWIPFNSTPVGASSASRVQDGGVGQYIHTKIYICRDSSATNARVDNFPTELFWYIDGYPYKDIQVDTLYDKMYKAFGVTRPTGVIVFTRRQSLQQAVDESDDGEEFLVTTGSTKLELAGTWGSSGTSPYTLTSLTGMVFPGASGFPYGSQGAAATVGG